LICRTRMVGLMPAKCQALRKRRPGLSSAGMAFVGLREGCVPMSHSVLGAFAKRISTAAHAAIRECSRTPALCWPEGLQRHAAMESFGPRHSNVISSRISGVNIPLFFPGRPPFREALSGLHGIRHAALMKYPDTALRRPARRPCFTISRSHFRPACSAASSGML
jgi:hypothetical protein